MKKKDIYTLFFLILLTLVSAVFAEKSASLKYISLTVLVLSAIKFLLVAFQFMELKKAHILWKILLICYLSIFFLIIGIVFTS